MEFYASCPEGFESALADELKRLGLSHVRRLKGRATFEGELEEGYRACLWSRLASRVFVVLGRFEAQDADELYDSVYDIAWETIIRPGATIAITARGVTEQLRNTRFSALRAKDALCDRLAETTGRRADVDAADPDVHLLLSLRQRRASISLDLSGDPLFKRLPPAATRAGEGAHVLRPDYAALVLAQVGWTALCERELTADDYENEALPTLIDASCAGGGLLLEAVNILTDRAPGAARERWGFEGWQLHDAVLWEQLLAEAREREAAARERQARIVAVDIDPAARKTAERMVKCAGYKRFVDFCAAKPATVLDHAGAVAGAALVADTTETPLSLMHDAMTLVGELRRAPELASAPVAALTRDGLMARALHAEPARSIAVMPNNEEATVEVWPSLDHAAAAFEAATSANAEGETADADDVISDEAADTFMPEPTATLDLGDGKPLPVLIPESEQFANRLRKNARLRRKWAKREGVSCYRVYDADLPDYSAAIDLYEGCPQTPGRWLVIAEYAAPKTIDPALAQARMLDILAIAPRILDVPAEHVHAKARMRSRGGSQYGKQGAGKGASGERANIARRRLPLIEEGGLTFAVNFDDYLDVGIFLDHRVTRNLVREHAKQARRFLNLFAYTGTATCYAADGGVEETVTVDLSNTYLDWAERNMRQNGFVGPQHHFVRDDVLAWIRDQRQTRNRWDLIFVDPPTFSNSSKMGRRTWDVQRDHVELLAGVSRLLAQGGHAIFSCNLRGFRPETRKLARAGVVLEDITAQTIPEDFARNQKVHHCYIVRRLPIEDAMAEVGFSAEEIAERTEELRNPEARKPRAAAPAHAQTGNGKPNFVGKPPPPASPKRKNFTPASPRANKQSCGGIRTVCLELGKFRPYFTATHIGMADADLSLDDQSVTNTHVRLDIARMRGVGLNLLAQRAHKDAQARQVALSCRAPNLVQDKLVRQYLVGVVCQQAQELILDRRQMQFLAIHRGDAGIKIDMQLAGIERALGDNAARLRIRKAPERRANAREQLLDRKRLGQIVVGTGIERADFVRVLAARRDHDNRHARPCAHRLHHLDAVHIGQAQIEQHNARRLRRGGGDSGMGGLHSHMAQAVSLERGNNKIADGGVVLNDQDERFYGRVRHSATPYQTKRRRQEAQS